MRKWSVYFCKYCLTFICLVVLLRLAITRISVENEQTFSTIQPSNCNIHFVQVTSSSGSNGLYDAVADCAIISAAVHHRSLNVCVHVYGKTRKWPDSFPNVHVLPLNVTDTLLNTPLWSWYVGRKDRESKSFLYHLVDGIRLALLYKFGGTYLDTDVISLTGLTAFRNTLGVQDAWAYEINGAVMIFEPEHLFLRKAMEIFVAEFLEKFSAQGPILMNKTYLRNEELFSKGRHSVNLTPAQVFYPVPYYYFYKIYQTNETKSLLLNMANSNTLHLWMKLYKVDGVERRIERGSIMHKIRQGNCFLT